MSKDYIYKISNAIKKICSQSEIYFFGRLTLKKNMLTKISKVQQDSGIFIFGEWSWEKLSRFLYILTNFILKETTLQLLKKWGKKRSD
jgi:hypothetical protein